MSGAAENYARAANELADEACSLAGLASVVVAINGLTKAVLALRLEIKEIEYSAALIAERVERHV